MNRPLSKSLAPLEARNTSMRLLVACLPEGYTVETTGNGAQVCHFGKLAITVGLCPRWQSVESSGHGHVVNRLERWGWEVRGE